MKAKAIFKQCSANGGSSSHFQPQKEEWTFREINMKTNKNYILCEF